MGSTVSLKETLQGAGLGKKVNDSKTTKLSRPAGDVHKPTA